MSGAGSFNKSRGPGGRDPNAILNQLMTQLGPVYGNLTNSIDTRNQKANPYIDNINKEQVAQANNLSGMRGQLDSLSGNLKRQALAGSDQTAVAAAQAAKIAGGGRGGAAFGGGGATAIASRAAQQAASGQSAALSSALIQGEQSKAAFDLNLAAQEAKVADSIQKGSGIQGTLFEKREQDVIDARKQLLDILGTIGASGIAGSGGSPSIRSRSWGTAGSGSYEMGSK